MKKMDRCLCGGKLEDVAVVRDGIHLLGQKCVECNEIYFDAEEMLRYEMLTGRRKGLASTIVEKPVTAAQRTRSRIFSQAPPNKQSEDFHR